MSLTADDIIRIMEKAKELGLLDDKPKADIPQPTEKELMAMIPKTPYDEMSEEEIKYYATPYWDEIQRQKEEKKKRIEEELPYDEHA